MLFSSQDWPADSATQVFAQNLVLRGDEQGEQKTVSENLETSEKRKCSFCATRRPLAAKHGSLAGFDTKRRSLPATNRWPSNTAPYPQAAGY